MGTKSHLAIFLSPAKGLRPRIFLAVFLLLAGWSTYFISVNADDFIQETNEGVLSNNILSAEAEKKIEEIGISVEDGKIIRKKSLSSTSSNSNNSTSSNDLNENNNSNNQPTDGQDEEAPTFIAFYADNQSDSDEDDQRHLNVVNRILATTANPIIHAGDILEDGTENSWNRFLNIAGSLLSTRAFYAALGNNDRVFGDSSTPSSFFLNYFNFPNNERWYSVNYGNLHLVVLDSAFSSSSPDQILWLEADLQSANSQSRITVVVFHHPTFLSVIDTQLVNYGVDFVVAGHIHAYSKNLNNGVYFFTLPGGTSIGHATTEIYSSRVTFKAYDQNGSLIESTQFNER